MRKYASVAEMNMILIMTITKAHLPEADSRWRWAAPSPSPRFFCITCFFCNHFEELQTVLFKVEFIINIKPLTYVYPKTIETPNHLLFGRQLL